MFKKRFKFINNNILNPENKNLNGFISTFIYDIFINLNENIIITNNIFTKPFIIINKLIRYRIELLYQFINNKKCFGIIKKYI